MVSVQLICLRASSLHSLKSSFQNPKTLNIQLTPPFFSTLALASILWLLQLLIGPLTNPVAAINLRDIGPVEVFWRDHDGQDLDEVLVGK